MNYDAILAIFNCIKDKIKYFEVDHKLKRDIPDDVKKWYEEWKKQDNSLKEPTKLTIQEGNNGELCAYYITPREPSGRVVTSSSDKEKQVEHEIKNTREQMIKDTIFNYLSNSLKNIDIPPFSTKKMDEESVYECKITSTNSEQIKIDYNEEELTTCIKIKSQGKHLKMTLLPKINNIRYDGMITLLNHQKKSHNFFDIFKKKSHFELNNKELADFISITKDEVKSEVEANGTIYSKEGVYIFEIKNNTFTINYFDQETITTISTTNLNKEFELTKYIKLLREQKELTNTDFIENLEKTGLLPNANYSIPCTSKELQFLANKAFINPRNLIEDLYRTK